MACAKLSVAWLSNRVAPRPTPTHRTIISLIVGWAAFSFLAIAFQCRLPAAWVFIPSQCPTHGRLQYVITAFNIITDVLLASSVPLATWSVTTTWEKRITLTVLFGLRLM
jgi:hypothetical protein